jgi:circadian clock protein KaiC
MHQKGDVGFTVVPGKGLVVLPVTAPLEQPDFGVERVSSGNPGLDDLMHGGVLRGSSVLLSGPTGTGKTLLATQFAANGVANGERVLYMAYEESLPQVYRNGASFGHDFPAAEAQGLLHVVPLYPEVASLDDHLVEVRDLVERIQPTRLIIDSLSALERLGSAGAYREFVIGVTSFVRSVGLASFLTSSSPHLVGAASVTESHISGLIDAIVVLRHAETQSALRRGILVLKMRGSSHEHEIRELIIGPDSIEVGGTFDKLEGILLGQPVPRG